MFVSVSERLPAKFGQSFKVRLADGSETVGKQHSEMDGWGWVDSVSGTAINVTHWKPNIYEEIIHMMKTFAESDDGYMNPNFLGGICNELFDFYGYEDDELNDWVRDMYGR